MREIAMFVLGVGMVFTVVGLAWANMLYLKRKQREWIKKQSISQECTATITSNGQVTIPKATLDALELKSGDSLRFVNIGYGVVAITHVN